MTEDEMREMGEFTLADWTRYAARHHAAFFDVRMVYGLTRAAEQLAMERDGKIDDPLVTEALALARTLNLLDEVPDSVSLEWYLVERERALMSEAPP